MTRADENAPLDAFDEDVLRRAATETGFDLTALRSLIRRQQEMVRELPGVEDIVYEWRRTLPRSPLVERRPDAYYLVVEARIWAEYAEALSLSPAELDALRAVHRAQLVTTVGADAVAGDDREPFVLTRP
jgi:hypothetical protein